MAEERAGAIVVGAGGGRRMGGVEKAFMELAGRPLIAHCVEVFQSAADVHEICLVVAGSSVVRAQDLVARYGWTKVTAVVAGGAERQDSVRAGLGALPGCEWVLVHDAARPLLTTELVAAGLGAARETGAAVAASPVRDTLKRAAGEVASPRVAETVDRTGLWAAQTPQVFRARVLHESYGRLGAEASRFTDDAALVQAAGFEVRLFPGDPQNVKVTLPEDVPLAEALVRARERSGDERSPHPSPLPEGEGTGGLPGGEGMGNSLRVGTGYDLHRTEQGRPLILGGVRLEAAFGLAGHSDADVLTHAVIDALFGACGLPDIGRHFPPGDARYAGADSIKLLREAAAIAGRAGFVAASMDATVVCERPKLAPHIDAMRSRLAGALGLADALVSVKAKTNEGLDAVGRGEAIAVHAIIMVRHTGGKSE